MARAVMLSIRPHWCELIASGKKTIELRKDYPRIKLPFKCYIYCTKRKPRGEVSVIPAPGSFGEKFWTIMGERVIGEFVCDAINTVDVPFPAYFEQTDFDALNAACLSYSEAHAYLGHRTGYGWHISDLKIYDEPKALTQFIGLREYRFGYAARVLRRPPQSFYFVEELL